jgi:hypothetical protein
MDKNNDITIKKRYKNDEERFKKQNNYLDEINENENTYNIEITS